MRWNSNTQKLIKCDWNLQNTGIEKGKKRENKNLPGAIGIGQNTILLLNLQNGFH